MIRKPKLKTASGKSDKENLSRSALIAKKLFIVTIFIIGQLMFYYSDFFKVKEIKITGNSRISDSKIIQTANIPLEHNLVTLPLSKFRQRLASIHWIKDVSVKWVLPGQVNIIVIERVPVALVRDSASNPPDLWYVADDEGMILYQAKPGEHKNYPRLVTDVKLEVGQAIGSAPIKAAREMDNWISADLKRDVVNYLVDKRGEVTIDTKRKGQNYQIMVGTMENMNHKMDVLGAVLELVDQGKTRVKYIDVRSSYPVVMPLDYKEPKEKDKKDSEKGEDAH